MCTRTTARYFIYNVLLNIIQNVLAKCLDLCNRVLFIFSSKRSQNNKTIIRGSVKKIISQNHQSIFYETTNQQIYILPGHMRVGAGRPVHSRKYSSQTKSFISPPRNQFVNTTTQVVGDAWFVLSRSLSTSIMLRLLHLHSTDNFVLGI